MAYQTDLPALRGDADHQRAGAGARASRHGRQPRRPMMTSCPPSFEESSDLPLSGFRHHGRNPVLVRTVPPSLCDFHCTKFDACDAIVINAGESPYPLAEGTQVLRRHVRPEETQSIHSSRIPVRTLPLAEGTAPPRGLFVKTIPSKAVRNTPSRPSLCRRRVGLWVVQAAVRKVGS